MSSARSGSPAWSAAARASTSSVFVRTAGTLSLPGARDAKHRPCRPECLQRSKPWTYFKRVESVGVSGRLVCPACNARYDHGQFCAKDGTALVKDRTATPDRVGSVLADRY